MYKQGQQSGKQRRFILYTLKPVVSAPDTSKYL
jgi:hypothetical protein